MTLFSCSNDFAHGLFALWLDLALHHSISCDELIDRAKQCNFFCPQLLSYYAEIRNWSSSFTDDYQLEVVFARPGNLGSIPHNFTSQALMSQTVFLFHPPNNSLIPTTESVGAAYNAHNGFSEKSQHLIMIQSPEHTQPHQQWILQSYSSEIVIYPQAETSTKELSLQLTRLQQNFIKKWHEQPQVLLTSEKTLQDNIAYYLDAITQVPLPDLVSPTYRATLERIHQTRAIISSIQTTPSLLSTECQQEMRKIEHFYYHALSATINTIIQESRHS